MSLADKFIHSEMYKALACSLKNTKSVPLEGDKCSSLQKQSGLKHPTYASSFIRQVGLAGLVLLLFVPGVLLIVCESDGGCVGRWRFAT